MFSNVESIRNYKFSYLCKLIGFSRISTIFIKATNCSPLTTNSIIVHGFHFAITGISELSFFSGMNAKNKKSVVDFQWIAKFRRLKQINKQLFVVQICRYKLGGRF